jgi:hypothetical protein
MNTKIYTSSGRRSVIPYVQCGCMLPLLILVSSIEELITREITSLGVCWVCSSGCERASLCGLDRLL